MTTSAMAVAPQLNYFGSELKVKFDNGWSISNNFLFDGGYMNTTRWSTTATPDTVDLHRPNSRICLPH